MFHKDTIRLIRKTAKRFITIFLIVLIGVGFMVGLMSSAPTMRKSVDKYFDEYDFMDVQLYSSYGFDDDDVAALRKSSNVEDIFATKFTDVFVKSSESTIVTRVQEIDSNINEYELVEGRMPEKATEALALGSSSYGTVFGIGDKIELYLEDDDLSETLTQTEYEIVGIVRAPQYMCSSKEISTLNNLALSTVIYVDNDNFFNDYYTSVYLTFKGSEEYDTFSDEYKDFIEENLDEFQLVIDKQEEVRKNKIYDEAVQEIADGEQELADEISKATKEIADAEQELADAYQQLLDAEELLTSSEDQVRHAEEQIDEGREKLSSAEAEIKHAKSQIEAQTGMSYSEAVKNINDTYGLYNMINSVLQQGELQQGLPVAAYTISEYIAVRQGQIDMLKQSIINLETENYALNAEIAALEAQNQELEASNSSLNEETDADWIAQNNQKISDNKTAISEKSTVITANTEAIKSNTEAIENLYIETATFEAIKGNFGDVQLGALPTIINTMFGGDITTVYQSIQQLAAGETELQNGKEELESNRKKVKKAREQVEEGKIELAENKQKYYDGLAEIADAKKELAEETEKARIDIDKAKQDLAELPEAEWTVLDRESHYSTVMFENNADQMQRIGNVFPMLFCLVAALVCMTTMKRLVDEQRSQIGVFSALGFSKGQIISKYVIYALSASLIGSGIGIPIGVFCLPWVIYFCWHMAYDLPPMVLHMPVYIAVIGVCLFTFLMVWVTFTVVRNVLKECPSQLMRPKAPRTAKKVFLEKIPFIWKRLSFTSKVTARNIIRYKSRFFMTVIGVAGCTSLLVLGFAIKGSISQVISNQYGDILRYDTTITLEDYNYLEDIQKDLLGNNMVEYSVPFMTYSSMGYTEEEEKAIQVYVMDDSEIADVIDLRNRKTKEKLSISNGVVISEKYAKLCGIDAGDKITIESSNGIKKIVEVAGICEMYANHFLFIGDDYYEDVFNETVYSDNIAVASTDSAALIKEYEDFDGVKTIGDFTETISTFSNMLEALDIIVVVIIIAAGSLALVVIMNLTEVNISERIREIATLKVLGFNNHEVYSYIFKEVFLLSLLGMIIGLPLGRLELMFVMNIIEMEMVMFSTVVQPSSYIYGFAIILMFTVMVIMLMRKTLRKVEMVESLKSVE